MNFLPNIFKKDPDKYFILNYAPIFAGLNPFEKILIMQKSKVVEYKKGDIIYKQSNPPTAFYCVISGRVRIFTHPVSKWAEPTQRLSVGIDNSAAVTLEYLNCGKYFGMISTLTGEPHSANAEAVNDSKILEVSQEDFKTILNKIPRLAIDLSKTLSRRLRKRDHADKKIFESNIISILSMDSAKQKSTYAFSLALSLKKETNKSVILIVIKALESKQSDENADDISKFRSIRLESSSLSDEFIKNAIFEDTPSGINVVNVVYKNISDSYTERLNAFLTYFTGIYNYIIVELPPLTDDLVFNTLNQSDAIHLIARYDTDGLKVVKALLLDLFQKIIYPQEKIKLILRIQRNNNGFGYEKAIEFLNCNIYATLPPLSQVDERMPGDAGKNILEYPEAEYSKAVRRIAREVGNVRVGLALGGGAAFGIAHLGVIKILEKENIPIDMIIGSSMGALIGALWASGLNSSKLENIFLEYNNNYKKTLGLLIDLCFPMMSIANGRNIRNFLKKHIGDKTFQDIKLPLKIVACNITRREELIFGSGKLIDAIMASIAIPGIFAPSKINGDLIIDGGIIEPVPIGALVKIGIKKIIAVNVLPSPENIIHNYDLKYMRQEAEQKQLEKENWLKRVIYPFRFNFRKAVSPNILDIIVNSIQTMEYVIAESDCQKADIVIKPIAEDIDWFDFFRVETLIKKGEEETVKWMAAIKDIIKE